MHKCQKTCGIYIILRTGTDECYIGQSTDITCRLRDHLGRLRRGVHRSPRMQNVFNKYGEGAFTLSILSSGFDPCEKTALTIAEQQAMDAHNCCYNACSAAASRAGAKTSEQARANIKEAKRKYFSDPSYKAIFSAAQKKRFSDPEQRAKMSEIRVGRPSPWKGRTPSPETRAKMSAAKKGKPSSFKGKTHSAESKAKASASKKGMVSPNKGKPRSPEANQKQSVSMKARFARLRELAQESPL